MPLDDPACFRLDRIPVRPIPWLWRPYLACGKLALLDGDPGARKSLSESKGRKETQFAILEGQRFGRRRRSSHVLN